MDDTGVTSGDPATWATGINHVTIEVTTPGNAKGYYHVDVTKGS